MANEKLQVCFIGPDASGKTNLLNALGTPSKPFVFSEQYESTIHGVHNTRMQINDGNDSLSLWELAKINLEKGIDYHNAKHFLPTANVVCIVLSATDKANITQETLTNWINFAKQNAPDAEIRIIVSKMDAVDVSFIQTFIKLAHNAGVSCQTDIGKRIDYCSAKTREGIDRLKEVFIALAKGHRAKRQEAGRQMAEEAEQRAQEQAASNASQKKPFTLGLTHYFGTSNAVRNSFLMGMLGLIGMILVGALAGPFTLMAASGVLAIFGATATVICGAIALVDFAKSCYLFLKGPFQRPIKNPTLFEVFKYMPLRASHKFKQWITKHKPEFVIGVLLFLAALTTIVMATFFPGTLAAIPFIANAVSFVGNALISIGLTGMATPLTALLAASLIGIVAITAWDVLCRVINKVVEFVREKFFPSEGLEVESYEDYSDIRIGSDNDNDSEEDSLHLSTPSEEDSEKQHKGKKLSEEEVKELEGLSLEHNPNIEEDKDADSSEDPLLEKIFEMVAEASKKNPTP